MRFSARLAAALLILAPVPLSAQQKVDDSYRPRVEHPAYAADGPVVAIDEAHRNFHRMGGRYAPFAALLQADGYRVKASAAPFSATALDGTQVLVVANARGPAPGAPAVGAAEVEAVKQWVEGGGSLLLVADHAPFGQAAAALAAAFGVQMGNGYVVARQDGRITANIRFSGPALGDHPILAGRDKGERVRHVTSFTGQSLNLPQGAVALLALPADAVEVPDMDDIAALRRGASVQGRRVGGFPQAIALSWGKGRVVVTGEAAMLTAQKMDGEEVGLAVDDDQRFALGILHWLSRALN